MMSRMLPSRQPGDPTHGQTEKTSQEPSRQPTDQAGTTAESKKPTKKSLVDGPQTIDPPSHTPSM